MFNCPEGDLLVRWYLCLLIAEDFPSSGILLRRVNNETPEESAGFDRIIAGRLWFLVSEVKL